MPQPTSTIEEHELPSIEAVLAGTLALMTGYSQALQAEHDPAQRLRMGVKIGANLALLVDHPMLSLGFRQVLLGLQGRWHAMSECTAQAARDCACACACDGDHTDEHAREHPGEAPLGLGTAGRAAGLRFNVPAPKRLQ